MIRIRTDEISDDTYTNHDYTFLKELLTYVSCELLFLAPELIKDLRKCILKGNKLAIAISGSE
jgi:hypothetical protein